MISDELDRKWGEAASAADFHMYDDSGGFMQFRIHDDVPTMLQVPIAWEAEDLQGADAVFVGIPWEGGVGMGNGVTWASCGPHQVDPDVIEGRTGAWDAPDYIRKCSLSYNINGSGLFYPDIGPDFRAMEHIEVMDFANVRLLDIWDAEEMARRAIDKVGKIAQAGAVPLVFGGDHSIPFPVVQAISDHTEGNIGIIWFDGHYDVGYGGEAPRPYNAMTRLNAENAMYRILKTANVLPENICLIGINTPNYNTPAMAKLAGEIGITVYTAEDVRRQGMAEIIDKALEVTTKGTEKTYITLDVDAMDPLTFPAQKYPEPMGISFHDIMLALNAISKRTQIAGMDMCCIGPAYDVNGLGGLCASRMYMEILKGLALKKMK